MRVISTKTHGMLEYPLAIALILTPNIFGFADIGGSAVAVPRIIGLLIIVLSLMTKYEFGVIKVISMVNHLRMDYLASLLLALSPFLFDFAEEEAGAWVPHVVAGLGYFVVSMMTKGAPDNPAAEK